MLMTMQLAFLAALMSIAAAVNAEKGLATFLLILAGVEGAIAGALVLAES